MIRESSEHAKPIRCRKCKKIRAACYYTVGDLCEDCQIENYVRYSGYSQNCNLMRTGDGPTKKRRT